jgi:RNA polymerase sigma-70 factor (ECF subfamily)
MGSFMNIQITPATEELLVRARAGDGEALGQALEGFRAYLTVLARVQIGRRLQGKVDAADLVQDVFLEAHRHFPHFRGTSEAELAVWLRQILAGSLANLVRHYFGTQQRDVRLERELQEDVEQSSQVLLGGLVAPHSSPSQGAVRREQAVLLAEALEKLPEDHRRVLVLRHLEGLPFPEVAQRMERSVEATKKLWMRALDRLRLWLGASS